MYQSARDLFDAAREAARDADRIERKLAVMDAEEGDEPLGSGGFEPRVRSTPDHDRMAARVASRVDRRAHLERRQEEDYRLIDAACSVLYGEDGVSDGLRALVGWRADAIYYHYLSLWTWAEVGDLLGYSPEHCCREASAAFDTADACGYESVLAGIGQAT